MLYIVVENEIHAHLTQVKIEHIQFALKSQSIFSIFSNPIKVKANANNNEPFLYLFLFAERREKEMLLAASEKGISVLVTLFPEVFYLVNLKKI